MGNNFWTSISFLPGHTTSIWQSCVQQGREHFSCFTWETIPKTRMAVLKINTRMGMLPQFPQLTVQPWLPRKLSFRCKAGGKKHKAFENILLLAWFSILSCTYLFHRQHGSLSSSVAQLKASNRLERFKGPCSQDGIAAFGLLESLPTSQMGHVWLSAFVPKHS